MLKRTLCLFIISALLLSFMPFSPKSSALPGPADNWADFAASGFESGSGTQADPYVIASAEQLAYLAVRLDAGEEFLNKRIVLGSDIDMSAHVWQTAGGDFEGTFDGRFYNILGLNAKNSAFYLDSSASACGLFGYIGPAGTVKNLLAQGSLTQSSGSYSALYMGGIAAVCHGVIEGCRFDGDISTDTLTTRSYATAYVGGIAGLLTNNGYIYGCHNGADITVNITSSHLFSVIEVGGIAGMANRAIDSCSNAGDISVSTTGICFAGGIGGIIINSNVEPFCVTNVYNTGHINAATSDTAMDNISYAGGLAGSTSAPINVGYSSGNVVITGNAPNIKCAYIAGFTENYPGAPAVSFSDLYYNEDALCRENSNDVTAVSGTAVLSATGMSQANMQIAAFADTLNTCVDDLNTANPAFPRELYIYGVYGTENRGYPSFVTLPGSGESDDPYIIDSAARLLYFSQNVSAGNSYVYKHFALVRDIDLCGDDGVLWTPVGSAPNPFPFSGTFDGRGHDITGMKLNYVTGTSSVYAGLFCWLNREYGVPGVIKNLNVTGDIDAVCTNNIRPTIGGIVAHSNGDIINCSFSGTIDASAQDQFMCGGIAGYTTGVINGCFSDAVINATVSAGATKVVMATGGIVGYTVMSDILNTYFSGTVAVNLINCSHADSAAYVGGIAGRLYISTIKNCYACSEKMIFCSSSANENEIAIGGMAGIATESVIENCRIYSDSSSLTTGSPMEFGSVCGKYDNVTVRFCSYVFDLNGMGENTDPDYVISDIYTSSALSSGVTVGPGTYHNYHDVLNAWTCVSDPDGSIYYGWAQLEGEPAGYVVFGPRAYPIGASTADNGTISADVYFAFPGDSVDITATPDTGYALDTQKYNQTAFTGAAFTMPAGPVTLSAQFELLDIRYALTHKYYTINPDETETLDGTVFEGTEFSGQTGKFVSGKYGDVLTDAILKNESFEGNTYGLFSAAASDGYTLNTDFSHSFELIYKRIIYEITLLPFENGLVEVSGGPTGEAGSAKTVTITPDTHYAVADVLIDGVSVGKVLSYSFEDLAQNHTVEVTFELVPNPDTGVDSPSPLLPAALALLCANALALLPLSKKLKSRR